MRIGIFLFIIAVLFSVDANACSVCFKGDPNQSANVAARFGVLMMLGVVGVVLGSFAYFFLSIIKRSTANTGKAK